ncbi:MAG: hypothetical protein ACREJW_08805 [Candidatus Methylomirabilales bacterium]
MNLRRRINILLIATLLVYAKKYSGGEISKDLTVRFDAKGFVKSYSFSSNEPEDMARLK